MSWGSAISTGGQYAAAGSMFGPWGTAIGGGIGLLMGAMSDDDASKVDVDKLLGPDLDKLRGRADQNSDLASKFMAKGDAALSPALSYFQSLLSGNPAAVMAATAPERGRVIDQYDTARKSIAAFSPAGGGTTGAAAQSRVTQGNELAEILSTARDKGAAGASQIGGQMLGAGLQTNALVSQDLNSVISAVLSGAGLQVQQEANEQAQDAAQGEAMGTMLGMLLSKYGNGKGGGLGGGGGGGMGGWGGNISQGMGG